MALGKTVISKIQLGNDSTASNNFLLKIPASPNGTVVLANGNDGSETDRIVLDSNGSPTFVSGSAVPAGGTAGLGVKVSTTSNLGIFFGSGAPTLSAAQGSLYIRTDGSSTTTRAYVNTNGSTTWTYLTAGA